jgi:hypothetical protein
MRLRGDHVLHLVDGGARPEDPRDAAHFYTTASMSAAAAATTGESVSVWAAGDVR